MPSVSPKRILPDKGSKMAAHLAPLHKGLKTAHHHVAVRPHNHLVSTVNWYKKWHEFRWHSHTHALILLVCVISGSFLFLRATGLVFASTATQTWNFSQSADFAFDAHLETSGTTLQHKAQNYASDANTVGLYHLDEVSGTSATDASSFANTGSVAGATFGVGNLNNSLAFNAVGGRVVAPDSASLSLSQTNTLEAWTKFSSPLTANSLEQDQGVIDKGDYKLYYDQDTGKATYELANAAATTWSQQAGNDIKGSWDNDGQSAINAQIAVGSTIYAAIGSRVTNAHAEGDAEVWKWNGTVWTKVGGDGLNGSWADQMYESATTLAINGTVLYVGLGTNNTNDSEVWSCDTATSCASWTKIGGDGINGGWSTSSNPSVASMSVLSGMLYVSLEGQFSDTAEVWRWNGTAWLRVGGFAVIAPYTKFTTGYNTAGVLTNDGTNLYVGLGSSTGAADVWRLTGTTWTQIGGDGLNSGWAGAVFENVRSMRWVGSALYVGIGDSSNDAEVWQWNGATWTMIGGDSTNSGWTTTYEAVYSLTDDGTDIYAGLGSSSADVEIWKYTVSGNTWTKVGGDGLNGSFSAVVGSYVGSLLYANSTLYAGLVTTGSSNNAEVWTLQGGTWTLIGGGYVNKSWGYYRNSNVQAMVDGGDYLYAGLGNTAGSAQVWRFNDTQWELIGGQGINSSWAANSFETVYSLSVSGGNLYVGLGFSPNDAEVWMWNGTSWAKIGGDGQSGSWNTTYEVIDSMAVLNGQLFVGLGYTNGDAEVWMWNGTVWTKIGGDNTNSGWNTAFSSSALFVYKGFLHVGLSSTSVNDVWRWGGASWTRIGGGGINSGWNFGPTSVSSMTVLDNKLYVGLGESTGQANVWAWNGTSWTRVAGDGLNSSWVAGQYEDVQTMTVYNGHLYVGLGNHAGDSEIWVMTGSTWTKVGGNAVSGSWSSDVPAVRSLAVYHGKLYAGVDMISGGTTQVWSYGQNGFLQSSTVGQNTAWHHLAASYDGATMKLFIDGTLDAQTSVTLSIPNSTTALLLGSVYGGDSAVSNGDEGYFHGSLDEVRISNVARSSLTTTPFAATSLTASPLQSVFTSGIAHWSGFSESVVTNGGNSQYRLSSDNGASWKYWNSSAWVTSNSEAQSNSATVINDQIATFPVVLGSGIKWQAVLTGNGSQRVVLNSVTVDGEDDITPPETNASDVVMYKTQGGDTVPSNNWTNGASPYFSWTPGTDSGAGLYGYCVYLGQSEGSDPASSKGILGTSPLSTTGTPCQFIVPGANLDLATGGVLSTPLASSSSAYYIYVAPIDKAGNVVTSSDAQFQFRFDNTMPTNPAFITAPSSFLATKQATLSWQTGGGDGPSDAHSGLAGLQYRIGNASPWYGDGHSGAQDASDLLTNDGAYSTQETPDFANLIDGNNTIYFRTWDMAGNVSTSYVSAALKINTVAPSSPREVEASPTTNTTNAFAFSWTEPETFAGDANQITYCYSVNAVPTVSNCTYTSAGVTNVTSGAYATQPGENTFYVAAKDEAGNINYATAASVVFEANTATPGMPLNLDVIDASIKATSAWRLALTWDAPTEIGAGISAYRVYRSTDAITYTLVTTTGSSSMVDSGLQQKNYSYKIVACDSANHCGASSGVVSKLPTGRFTTSAIMLEKPVVSNISTQKATIKWVTDRTSDSRVALGSQTSKYSTDEVSNSEQVVSHTINLTNLAAGRTYFAKARWTDEDGNLGSSDEFSFSTQAAPMVKEVTTKRVGLNDATVQFTSVGASQVKLYYGKSDAFGGTKALNTSVSESVYDVPLVSLEDATKYFFKVNTFDSDGNEYDSGVYSFTTLARPKISNLRFEPIEGEPTSTQQVSWTTNVPTTATISYKRAQDEALEVSNSTLLLEHELIIRDLLDDSEYTLTAFSRDATGNEAISDEQVFKTALDTRPPKISNVVVETSVKGAGPDARGQIVVSWKTDEPATSQVSYGQGASGSSYASKTAENVSLGLDHVVIISDLSTSTVFHLQAVSSDRSGNSVGSVDQSTIIGRGTDSVLDIIFSALSNVFGFLR